MTNIQLEEKIIGLVQCYKATSTSLFESDTDNRDFFLFLLFWYLHESNLATTSGKSLNISSAKDFISDLEVLASEQNDATAIKQSINAALSKIEMLDKRKLLSFLKKSFSEFEDLLPKIELTSVKCDECETLYRRVLFRLIPMNATDHLTKNIDYEEIPTDFIELISGLDSTEPHSTKSAYFPYETTGEQCVNFAAKNPDCAITIESIFHSPHLMRMLALVGAKNVNLSFGSPIHKDANVKKETFDLACTLLQPTKVNEKREEGKKFEPIKGDFSPERLISKSVPRMYKEHGYLQHTLWSLNKLGVAYFVIGKGPLFREGEENARKILVDRNAIDTIVMLPSNLMTFNALPLFLLVLRKTKQTESVLFVDATQDFSPDGKRNRLTNIDKIIDIVSSRKIIDGVSVEVSNDEIIDKDYSLNPQYYFEEKLIINVNRLSLESDRKALIKSLANKQINIAEILKTLGKSKSD
jgi:hypothetical protein